MKLNDKLFWRFPNILFIHGIVGNCSIFKFLLPYLPEGSNVKFMNLEGHGGDALAFSKTSMSVWRKQVEEAVDEIKENGPVAIVAHSMGCLLALEQASMGKIDRLFLLNPPLKIRIHWRMFANAIKVITGHYKHDPIASAAKDSYGISMDFNPLHYYGWPARYLELFTYIAKIRKLQPKVMNRSYAFLAANDEMVSVQSKDWIERWDNFTSIILSSSNHYYYSDQDRNLIANCFKNKFL